MTTQDNFFKYQELYVNKDLIFVDFIVKKGEKVVVLNPRNSKECSTVDVRFFDNGIRNNRPFFVYKRDLSLTMEEVMATSMFQVMEDKLVSLKKQAVELEENLALIRGKFSEEEAQKLSSTDIGTDIDIAIAVAKLEKQNPSFMDKVSAVKILLDSQYSRGR